MTLTEKIYVATFSACLALQSKSSKGIACFNEICSSLNVTSDDVRKCMLGGEKMKEIMYQALKKLSSADKKVAQQYFAKAALVDCTQQTAGMLNEILEECNMFDAII